MDIIRACGALGLSALVGAFASACSSRKSPTPSEAVPLPSALEASCSACHHGETALDFDAPGLRERLRAFREDEQAGLIMPRIASALTDDDIDALAVALGVERDR